MTDVESELSRNLLRIRLVWLFIMAFCTGPTGTGQHSALLFLCELGEQLSTLVCLQDFQRLRQT